MIKIMKIIILNIIYRYEIGWAISNNKNNDKIIIDVVIKSR